MATQDVTSSGVSGSAASRGGDQAHGSESFPNRPGVLSFRRSISTAKVEEGPTPRPTSIPSPTATPTLQIDLEKVERRDLLDSRKDMLVSMNAYSVVLVLLASITFVGFLQPPGGLKQDGTAADGTTVAGTLQRPGFYINNYIVPLTIAFYLAVAGILVCMSCIIFVLRLPQKSDHSDSDKISSLQRDNKKLRVSLKWAGIQEVMINAFFSFSLFCCTLAFVYAGYTVTDGEQRKLLRRVLIVFETINATFFVTYSLALILSCFFSTPLCYDLDRFVEWLIKASKKIRIIPKASNYSQGFIIVPKLQVIPKACWWSRSEKPRSLIGES